MDTKMIGYHVSPDNIGNRKVYQVFLGSPRKYYASNAYRISKYKSKIIVVHAPYWTNLVKPVNDRNWIATLKHTVQTCNALSAVGQKYYVIHVGARKEYQSVSEGMDSLREFCLRFLSRTQGTNVKLCIENDSGSIKGTKMGSVNILSKVITDINSSRIKMTYDVEHSYANGFDLSDRDRLKSIANNIAVVHFNPIPKIVDRGSHLDRHSTTTFYNSKYGFDYINNVYQVLYDGKRPFIIESQESYALKSLELMEGVDGAESHIEDEERY